jgi:hypothetical protein
MKIIYNNSSYVDFFINFKLIKRKLLTPIVLLMKLLKLDV